MAEIPQGAATAAGEGADLVSAIEIVAKELEIAPNEVAYKLDLAHFRSNSGASVAKRTVRIIGWKGEGTTELPKASKSSSDDDSPREERRGSRDGRRGSRKDRRGSKKERRGSERGERKARSKEPMEGEPTEASEFAVAWFKTLLEFMDVNAKVEGIGNDERVRVSIEADKAGRIIGKRGSTLRSIRHILGLALNNKFGELIIDVDVADDRDGEEPKRERRERRERSGDDRRRRGGRRGSSSSNKSGHPREKLEALARRAAEKAIETNKTITINLELNSYDRRIVHMAISEVDGVESRSEERDGTKFVQVIPAEE